MANITKRGDTYRIRVSGGYDLQGKQKMLSMTWQPAPGMTERQIEKELQRQAMQFEDKCNGLSAGANVKFEVLAKEWLEYIEKAGTHRIRTIDRLKQTEERIYKGIGHLRMDKISNIHIQRFIDNLAEKGVNKKTGGGLAPKTRGLYLNFISDVFEYAIHSNMIKENPCRRVFIKAEQQTEKDCYTLEEAQQFLIALEDATTKFKVFYTLAMYCGFRRAELLGLEWKDIDFNTGVISIRRTSLYTAEKGLFTDTTKTKGSQRSLKLQSDIIPLLRTFKAEQAAERLLLGDAWIDTDRLFVGWNGKPLHVDSARQWLVKFCGAKGLRFVPVHSFRHLNASLLISSGVDVKTVSASLGHSQASTTLNIYAHSFAVAQAAAGEAVADKLRLKDTSKQA